jgi:hypothetical protein
VDTPRPSPRTNRTRRVPGVSNRTRRVPGRRAQLAFRFPMLGCAPVDATLCSRSSSICRGGRGVSVNGSKAEPTSPHPRSPPPPTRVHKTHNTPPRGLGGRARCAPRPGALAHGAPRRGGGGAGAARSPTPPPASLASPPTAQPPCPQARPSCPPHPSLPAAGPSLPPPQRLPLPPLRPLTARAPRRRRARAAARGHQQTAPRPRPARQGA